MRAVLKSKVFLAGVAVAVLGATPMAFAMLTTEPQSGQQGLWQFMLLLVTAPVGPIPDDCWRYRSAN